MIQNYLNPIEFKLVLERLPHIEFFIQSINIPGISSGVTEQPTPFRTVYFPGDKITFEDLTMTVLVDEDLKSYYDAWFWLSGLTRTDGFDSYQAIESGDGISSDASLFVTTNAKNPNIQIKFKDMFPVSIGSISLATNQSGPTPVTFDITFRYSAYEFVNIS